MKNEQTINTTTLCTFDFVDRLKILFGKKIEIKVYSTIPFSEPPINSFNSNAFVSFPSNSKFKMVEKNKPDFGYSPIINE